jgi:hypothetical protein
MSSRYVNSDAAWQAAVRLIADLNGSLWSEWGRNHGEHCDIDWPHPVEEGCDYPPPEALIRSTDWLVQFGPEEWMDPRDLFDDHGDAG